MPDTTRPDERRPDDRRQDEPRPAVQQYPHPVADVEKVHPALEFTLVTMVLGSVSLAVLGALSIPLRPDLFAVTGRYTEAVAVVLAAIAVALSGSVTTLRHMTAGTTGGRAYDLLRGQSAIRVASILTQMLVGFSVILLAGRVAIARGLMDVDVAPEVLDNGLRVVAGALAAAIATGLWQSLRYPTERTRSLGGRPVAYVACLLAVGLAVVAALVTAGYLPDQQQRYDSVVFVLSGLVMTALALRRMRGLPGLVAMSNDRIRERARGGGEPHSNTVLAPAILAFALMLLVFLLFILFGLGASQVISGINRSPVLVGVMAAVVLSIVGSLALAFTLSREQRRNTQLYREFLDPTKRRVRIILIASAIAATGAFVLAALTFDGHLDESLRLQFVCFGLMTALGPYGFYAAYEHRRIRRLEERFPDYLRDLAASHAGGLTLAQAATIAARGEYGDLTPEVRKIADQLSWNVPFSEALLRFAERVHTPLVLRAVNLILQADRSGGSTIDVLLAAARDAREIKTMQTERRLSMSLYTVVVYVTFFVFLGVVAVLYLQFAPKIVGASSDIQQLQGSEGFVASGLEGSDITLADYRLFYFLASVVQAIGDGVVAELLAHGRASLGLRHAFIMVFMCYLTFVVLPQPT